MSLGFRQKSVFLHLLAYSYYHCRAFLFSRRSVCLAFLRAWWFSADGCFIWFLKAWFLASIHCIKISSASVIQSGQCLILAVATSSATDLMCSSKSSIRSEGVEKMLSSLRLSQNSSTFFWKFLTSLLRSVFLSIFWFFFHLFLCWLWFFFFSRGLFSRRKSMDKVAHGRWWHCQIFFEISCLA